MRGQAKNWSDRAELLGIIVPGFRSRNLTPFGNATSILGPKNGPDFGTVFVTDRARIFVAASANQEAVRGAGVGGMDLVKWGGVGEGSVR